MTQADGTTEKRLREALESIQWPWDISQGKGWCRICTASKKMGHAAGCSIGKALAIPKIQAEIEVEAAHKVCLVAMKPHITIMGEPWDRVPAEWLVELMTAITWWSKVTGISPISQLNKPAPKSNREVEVE